MWAAGCLLRLKEAKRKVFFADSDGSRDQEGYFLSLIVATVAGGTHEVRFLWDYPTKGRPPTSLVSQSFTENVSTAERIN